MAHKHSVYDTDKHFVIDPITKVITNQATNKIKLMQFDHNSERFTFEIPREVEGHDMSLCNKVEIHYININAATKEQNKDVYLVNDLQLSPESDDVVIFSWLISNNATLYAGLLNFFISFKCMNGATIEYQWSADIFKGITVGEGINNGEALIEEYSDILEAWKDEALKNLNTESDAILEEWKNGALQESLSEWKEEVVEDAKAMNKESFVPRMSVLDEERIETSEPDPVLYAKFIGGANPEHDPSDPESVETFSGYNRIYAERSRGRGAYPMFALTGDGEDIPLNPWSNGTDENGNPKHEPLSSIAERRSTGDIYVPLTPGHNKAAVSLYYLLQAIANAKTELTNKMPLVKGNGATSITRPGMESSITGEGAIGIGYNVKVSGKRGVGIGSEINVAHELAMAFGYKLKTSAPRQIVLGESNTDNVNAAIIYASRSRGNVFELMNDGRLKIADPKNNNEAATKGFLETQIGNHNTNGTAHADIRTLISELAARLNTVANSDDVTLDQLKEIVSYIKNNKSLIDGITTSKVNVSDIVDDLVTTDRTKPLSAYQGYWLKTLIDAINVDLESIPTSLSELTEDSEHRTVTDAEREAWNNKSELAIPKYLNQMIEDSEHRTVTDAEKVVWYKKMPVPAAPALVVANDNFVFTPGWYYALVENNSGIRLNLGMFYYSGAPMYVEGFGYSQGKTVNIDIKNDGTWKIYDNRGSNSTYNLYLAKMGNNN
jgi:hypothetical protein